METWYNSPAYGDLTRFIILINQAVVGKTIHDPCHTSPLVQSICTMLNELKAWIQDIPLINEPQRFGNRAFRTWTSKLETSAPALVESLLTDDTKSAGIELAYYLSHSFGNGQRLDYGSGHELNFCAFLTCLFKLELLEKEDAQALATRVFVTYLDVARALQITYRLEPAGSHGVWGLDDYQFLPYYWGSGQLIQHPTIHPRDVLKQAILDMYADEYLYLDCIRFIHKVKRGPFHEHSPILHDISQLPHWQKVNVGLGKMYEAEVLKKFPVVQHMWFGTLLSFQ